MQEIIPPSNCPSCDSTLTFKNDVLYCLNSNCDSKLQKSIEHWAKALKIKGLGPRTIEKLDVVDVAGLYSMNVDYIQKALGSEKLASKLVDEINKSKHAKLNQVLPAFGIPLIGNSATEKICTVVNNLEELSIEKCKEAGLGPKATENLMSWYSERFIPELINLPFDFEVEKRPSHPQVIKGIVCITGKLKSYKTKAEATKVLEKAGYKVKSSVTKDVTIVVNESGIESEKTKKARDNGLTIVTNVNQLIGETKNGIT